jgi:hypothetical protein
MKHFRIFLFWALITGSTSVALGQQSKPGSDREKGSDRREKVQETKKSDSENDPADADDEDDSEHRMAALRNGGNGRAPDPRNRSKNMVASDVYEALAVSASEEFAEDFGITDAKDRDELLRACRKYYRAKELLDAQFADKESGPYLKKSEVLEREYSKELRRVLPES